MGFGGNSLIAVNRASLSLQTMWIDPSIQAPPLGSPALYYLSRKEDSSIEFSRGHYQGVSTLSGTEVADVGPLTR